jgi:hypothetical protein
MKGWAGSTQRQAVLEAAAKFGSGSGGTMVNSDRCTECRRKRDVADTVLVLCDKCPRAFHLGCLRMTEDQLPTGDWKCPRCVEKEAYVQQRYREILHLKRLLEVRRVAGHVSECQPSQSLSLCCE